MPNDQIGLEHAKSFTDVVFGVLIALPLTDAFPRLVSEVVTKRCSSCGESLLLLSSALVFSTFYWFEVRRFIDEQNEFDAAIGINGLSLGRILGSLGMVALVATILYFANIETLRAFLIANLLFWVIDLFGNIGLKFRYKPQALASLKKTNPEKYKWYDENIRPRTKGPFYSSINIAFFGLVLLAAYRPADPKLFQLGIASLILVFTLVRHLLLRIKF